MNLKDYAQKAMTTAPSASVDMLRIHAAMGICGEAGELMDHMKKVTFNNKDLDEKYLVAELGDICWYMNLMITALGTTWEHVFDVNIAKLSARYPQLQYSHDSANSRDLDAEKAAMAAV
jgi:hypothetical protein